MNKYIYKVRYFLIITKTKSMHKQLANNNSKQVMKQFEKYECFMSILTKISCLNFGSLNFKS